VSRIFWIEGKGGFKRLAAEVKSPECSCAAPRRKRGRVCCGEKFDDFRERRDGGGGIGFEQENAEIKLGFGHFWVQSDGFSYSARASSVA